MMGCRMSPGNMADRRAKRASIDSQTVKPKPGQERSYDEGKKKAGRAQNAICSVDLKESMW